MIFQNPVMNSFAPDEYKVAEIELKRGINVVVFKVVQEYGPWAGSVHFTDRDGNPVKGIKVTLDPQAREAP
jgi:hypothetical protein